MQVSSQMLDNALAPTGVLSALPTKTNMSRIVIKTNKRKLTARKCWTCPTTVFFHPKRTPRVDVKENTKYFFYTVFIGWFCQLQVGNSKSTSVEIRIRLS